MANGNQIGLNGQEASRALSTIEESYVGMIDNFNSLQGGIVATIGKCWFGKDAVQFARDKFKPAIEEIGNEVQKVFQSVNDTITQNAKNFEAKHQTNVFSPVPHLPKKVNIDASVVLESQNGFIGLSNIQELEHTRQYWLQVLHKQEALLSTLQRAAAQSGFYGESQQERLNESINKIKASINEITQELNKATQAIIDATQEEEKRIAQQNASTM